MIVPSSAVAFGPGGDGMPVGGGAVAEFAPPRETCGPDETRLVDGFNVCTQYTGGGFNVGGLIPFVVVIAAGGVLLAIAAAVILRRTAAPTAPADPGEWWTCRNCGKTNVLGSARCYACGAWQG